MMCKIKYFSAKSNKKMSFFNIIIYLTYFILSFSVFYADFSVLFCNFAPDYVVLTKEIVKLLE